MKDRRTFVSFGLLQATAACLEPSGELSLFATRYAYLKYHTRLPATMIRFKP